MPDRAIPSSLANLFSELATSGSRHEDSFIGEKFTNPSVDIHGLNSITEPISQMEQDAENFMGRGEASYTEITRLLSANAEGAQYALRKFQNGLNEYLAAEEHGKEDAVGGFGVVRSRAFGIFATSFPDVQAVRGVIPTLVNHNDGTFGTVGTGGIVKKPTSSTLPHPTTAALPSHNPTWGTVGEEGDVKPPTTTTKPKAGRRPVILGIRSGIGALRYLPGRDLQIQ